jgi:hypothetical protein
MSQIARQLLLHAAGGFAISALFVAALAASEAGLVLRDAPPGPLVLLWLFCGTTFAAGLGALSLAAPAPVPVPVRVRRGRR